MPQGTNFRLFNPDTMAKPVAGYSQVAEVMGGNLVYVAGQVALDLSAILLARMTFERRPNKSSRI
jgi:enamine deaminase RidA (YjgF/YER057c/UK114 family)